LARPLNQIVVGHAALLSTRDVWTEVVAFRATTPDVIAILEHCSYQGFLQRATSGASDAYIYCLAALPATQLGQEAGLQKDCVLSGGWNPAAKG